MKRLPALDMLRGYALICIMIDHALQSVLQRYTLSKFVLFDAAELFVLLSGFLVGTVWIREATAGGQRAAQRRFAIRAWQVWRALIVGAVLMAALSAGLQALELRHLAIWPEYGRMILRDPLQYVIDVGTMWMQPNLLDVLALYVLLIAVVPLMVPAILRWPWLTAAAMIAVWSVSIPLNNLIPNQRPSGAGFQFNPFGWQILFFTGTYLGLYRREIGTALRPYSAILTVLSVAMLIFGGVVIYGWNQGLAGKSLQDALFIILGPIDKWSLDGVRYLSIMAACWLVAAPLAPLFAWIAASGAGRAMATIGRGGLISFIACVLLSVLGDALHGTVADSTVQKLVIDVWIIGALWLTAWAADHSGRRIRRL